MQGNEDHIIYEEQDGSEAHCIIGAGVSENLHTAAEQYDDEYQNQHFKGRTEQIKRLRSSFIMNLMESNTNLTTNFTIESLPSAEPGSFGNASWHPVFEFVMMHVAFLDQFQCSVVQTESLLHTRLRHWFVQRT